MRLSLFLFLLLILPLPARAQNALNVSDGDTVRINNQRIRLACIDAPESNQPFGRQSTHRLRELLSEGKTLHIQVLATDRYGRTIAKLYSGDVYLQEVLVREGLAWVYPQFLNRCPTTAARLQSAQTTAQQRRIGLWADPNPIPPWVWRRRR